MGAPIFDNSGRVEAAVSVTGLVSQIQAEDFPALGAVVRETADAISRALGATIEPLGRRTLDGVELGAIRKG